MYYQENNSDQRIQTIVASGSVDSSVRIWTRHSGYTLKDASFSCAQEIKSKANGFALALKFYLLPLAKRNSLNLLFTWIHSKLMVS